MDAFGFGHVYEQARCRWRLADAHLAAGDRGAASVPARAAWEAADAMGAVPLRRALEALARRGRLDIGVPSGPEVLTDRERDVLTLVAEGHTNRRIGELLFISEKTASVHVRT